MTTLFNLFCPFTLSLGKLMASVFFLFSVTYLVVLLVSEGVFLSLSKSKKNTIASMFPLVNYESLVFSGVFLVLSLLNLISLVAYSYPVTTTLSFNLSMAFSLWVLSVLILSLKPDAISSLLPLNSPWYLAPFLGLVELVSTMVRPVTLCFRLLANMSAGHILLSLISKMSMGMWLLGSLFGLLELMVAVVQSFVFLMLVSVYLEEGLTH